MFQYKKTKVEFFAKEGHLSIFHNPLPAHKSFPTYFLDLKPQTDANPATGTVKRCVPFLDAMSQGFIIPMWCDVWVTASNGTLDIKFPDNLPMETSLSPHGPSQIKNHPLSRKPYGDIPLKWHSPWGVKTPRGYSCLFTTPLNHLETRFKILDGVVDTDTYYNQVNFPFVWTGGDGSFLIGAGTPLVHVLPFKREKFECVSVIQDDKKQTIVSGKIGTVMRNAYKTMFWHKNVED